MFLKRIQNIRDYKSYHDFCWEDTCVPQLYKKEGESNDSFAQRSENIRNFAKTNIIFGENGAGKSALVDILKSSFNLKTFVSEKPSNVNLIFKELETNFNGTKWDNTIESTKLIVFDSKFIRSNVHIHGDRPGNDGEVKQNATRLLLTLSEKANILARKSQEARTKYNSFDNASKSLRSTVLVADKDRGLYKCYKDKTTNEIKDEISEKERGVSILEEEKGRVDCQIKNNDNIRALKVNYKVTCIPALSLFVDYSLFFKTKIEKQALNGADKLFFEKISSDQMFYSQAYDKILTSEHKDCPVCGKALGEIIDIYNSYFDETFEKGKEKFQQEANQYRNEIREVKSFFGLLKSQNSDIFTQLQLLQSRWGLFGTIDFIEKRKTLCIDLNESLCDVAIKKIDTKSRLEEVEYSIEEYNSLKAELEKGIRILTNSGKLFSLCIKEIEKYKDAAVDIESMKMEFARLESDLIKTRQTIEFLKSGKIDSEKLRQVLEKRLKKLKNTKEKCKARHYKYLTSELHQKQIGKMQQLIQDKFRVNFKLLIKQPSKRENIEIPFDFEIKKGTKPIVFNDLSEGERQIISISFFFASIEDIPDKKQIILLFDDPVTSMDARNLKLLSNLIKDRTKEFSQIFILTHHDLFNKYCTKNSPCFRFGLIKNSFQSAIPANGVSIEQSILYRESEIDVKSHIVDMQTYLADELKKGTFNYETFVLKYAQFLRYAIEDFIKNELLHWEWKKDKEFDQIIDSLKSAKEYSDSQLNNVKSIYNFCNWSNTSHVDKEEITSFQELKAHVDDFVNLYI